MAQAKALLAVFCAQAFVDAKRDDALPQEADRVSSLIQQAQSIKKLELATQLHSSGFFATIPVKFVVIKKQDGTGHLDQAALESKMVALRKYYSGDDPNAVSPAQAAALNQITSTPDSCGQKCDVANCYENGKYRSVIDLSGCFCDDDYCEKWTSIGNMHGSRANANVDFTLESVTYTVNDEWHDQCCCAHAGGLSYEPKQVEIMDQLIDKSTVRSKVTIIVCDMKSTMGQALISGSPGCDGGPGIMLTHTFDEKTLAHEFGHFFGLYHTFNEECPAHEIGNCQSSEVCDEQKNLGDRIADTPVHKKQGACAGTWNADSCPGGGKDPLDNIMSYSGCSLARFTEGQVTKMRQTITDYYPDFLTDKGNAVAKDLPCNPSFPGASGVPSGYAPPTPPPTPAGGNVAPAPAGPAPSPGCNLEEGQCDTHDKKGCYCHDASICCSGHGCGGMPGMRQCLPCEWKAWGTDFTADSCGKPKRGKGKGGKKK